jgi:Tfp pilus assembly protein PilV
MPGPLNTRPRRQRGIALPVAVALLAAMGLLAAWAMRSSAMNIRVVGNTQARVEATAAAQAAIERTISSAAFSQQPAAVAANPIPVDVDGDGTDDLVVLLQPAPTCYRWRAIRTVELNPAVAADLACLGSSSAGNAGVDNPGAAPGGDSLCADSEWNVRATVTDPETGTRMAINQGVAIRGLITDVMNNCPAPPGP